MKIFKSLERIMNTLIECPDPDINADRRRKPNGYSYKDCPNKAMKSEILGSNFRVDAVIANPDLYKDNDLDLAAAQTAVAMEFKKEATSKNVHEVGAGDGIRRLHLMICCRIENSWCPPQTTS
jgi:hypothetical protein